ncbi:MAG: hypothetical protein M1299_11245 [Firmicutes bacterium]|nr:hypothetical protein [Bacillota bacterium]
MWPYKFKIKIAGCPNDCVASVARADFSQRSQRSRRVLVL